MAIMPNSCLTPKFYSFLELCNLLQRKKLILLRKKEVKRRSGSNIFAHMGSSGFDEPWRKFGCFGMN